MTELWLVRHGQTDWNLEGRYQGQSDIALNSTGLSQAYALAERLDGWVFNAIYSSDLQRARQTAEVLADRLGLPVNEDARLREICQGEWEGMRLSELRQIFAENLAENEKDPLHARAPGGESTLEVAERVGRAVDEIAAAYPQSRVLVISHGFAVATLICRARQIPLAEVYAHIPENASYAVVEWGK